MQKRRVLTTILFIIGAGVIMWVYIYHFIIHMPETVDSRFIVKCRSFGQRIMVVIFNEGFKPEVIKTHACDMLIFTNKDTKYHQVAFGKHTNHLFYPGFYEKPMAPNSSNSVILTAYGEYNLHDHFYETLQGRIIISK